MDRLKPILALLFVLANLNLAAQVNKNPDELMQVSTSVSESIFVHLNTGTLVTGESLLCKVYCIESTSGNFSPISKIAYLEIIDRQKNSVARQKISLENGNGQADFFIPASVKTGNYKVIAYTNWTLHASAYNFFETDINIINPFETVNSGKIIDSKSNDADFLQTAGLTIGPSKNTYANREKVTLDIQFPSGKIKGKYSVSVRKLDNLPVPETPNPIRFKKSATRYGASAANEKIIPELRGELISGSITSKTGAALKNKTIALSVSGKQYSFKLVETNASGNFTFILDQNQDNPDLVIQVVDENYTDFAIKIDPPATPDLSKLLFAEGFLPQRILKNTIEERSVAAQVENANFNLKRDSLQVVPVQTAFYEPLATQYKLDDYTRFPTMKETITEILKEVYFNKTRRGYTLHLRNRPMQAENYGKPLVMVDGLLIQDIDEIFAYSANDVEKISFVNHPYIYGPRTFSGIIDFITKEQHFQTRLSGDFIKKMSFQRPLPKKDYFSPVYSAAGTNSRIPDYRFQLLWLPEVEIAQQNNISFYTSDISGKFEVVLEGFAEDGTPLTAKTFINVK